MTRSGAEERCGAVGDRGSAARGGVARRRGRGRGRGSAAAAAARGRGWWVGLVGVGWTLAVLGAWSAGLLGPLEGWLTDVRARAGRLFSPPASERIVHVDIDQQSLDAVGRWPWDRAELARAVDTMTEAGAAVIVLDITLDEPTEPRWEQTAGAFARIDDDAELARALAAAGSSVLAATPGSAEGEGAGAAVRRAVEPIGSAASAHGLVTFGSGGLARADRAGVVREAPAGWFVPSEPVWQLGLTAAAEFEGAALRRAADGDVVMFGDRRAPAAGGRFVLAWPAAREHASEELLATDPLWMGLHRRFPIGPYVEHQRARGTWRRVVGVVATGRPLDADPTPEQIEEAVEVMAMTREFSYEGRTLDEEGARLEAELAAARASADASVEVAADLLAVMLDEAEVVLAGGEDRSFADWRARVGRYLAPARAAGDKWIDATLGLLDERRREAAGRWRLRSETEFKLPWGEDVAIAASEDPVARLIEARAARERHAAVQAAFDSAAASARAAREVFRAKREELVYLTDLKDLRYLVSLPPERGDPRTRMERYREQLEGKLVFVGWTAAGAVADFYPTAMGVRTPGVSVHAAVADAALSGHWVRRAPGWTGAALILFAGLSATAVAMVLPVGLGTLAAAGLTAGYAAANVWLLWDWADVLVPAAGPIVAAVGAWAVCGAGRAVVEGREKAAIRRQFRSRVSEQLVDLLADNPGLMNMEGEERELTVMFTDFAGFTSLSEKLGGRETVALLNAYLRELTEVLLARGAYVNKFLGDGVMAFWGAPVESDRHAGAALEAAVEAVAAVERLNRERAGGGEGGVEGTGGVGMRIGVSTGRVIVGDCGAPPRLNDYTVIGDAVNLAARLESANKALGTGVLVTGRTVELLSDAERSALLLRPMGRVRVVGQSVGVEVWELVGRRGAVAAGVEEWARKWADAVGAVSGGDPERAAGLFGELAREERGGSGAALWAERCGEIAREDDRDAVLALRGK